MGLRWILVLSLVDCPKITEDKSSDAELTRGPHSIANLASNGKRGPEIAQCSALKCEAQLSPRLNWNAELDHAHVSTQARACKARVPSQTRSSTTPASQLKCESAKPAFQPKHEAQPSPRSNLNVELNQVHISTQMRACEPHISTIE